MVKKYKLTEIDILSEILENDGVISIPTDTVYGLCARIDKPKAQKKLIDIKNRPIDKNFPIMCKDIEEIKTIAIVNKKAEKIINNLMPGPITVILKKTDTLPKKITNGKDTVAVRIAFSKEMKNLMEKTGPLFMTSANKSGEPTSKNIKEIEKNCPDVDAIVTGKVIYKQGSTIIDCTTNKLIMVREGPISLEEIEKEIK